MTYEYVLRDSSMSLFDIPHCKTEFGKKRLGYFLPCFLKKTLKSIYTFNFNDYKKEILNHISKFHQLFLNHF